MRPAAFAAVALATATATAVVAPAAPAPRPVLPRLLAASGNGSGDWEIYVVDPDTRKATNVTNHPAADAEPCWSPDGKRIAFVSDRSGAAEVWVMAADGTGPKQLTRGADLGPVTEELRVGTKLRWSPDGRRIAFVGGKAAKENVFTVDPGTGAVVQVTADEFPSAEPDWSPDGTRLLYTYFRDGQYALRMANPDGSGRREVTDEDGGDEGAWSPDGRRVAFVSLRGNRGFQLYTIAPAGGEVTDLKTFPARAMNAHPRWSPDGKTIAFGEWEEVEKGRVQVAVVGADGAGYKVLTADAAHAHPRWSPDGRSLSYGRYPDQHGYFRNRQQAALVVGDADGKNARDVLTGYGSAEWKPK